MRQDAWCNSPFIGGTDRETDDDFRARIKEYARGLGTATLSALVNAVKNREYPSGRVRFVKLSEDFGSVTLWIDDGSGRLDVRRTATEADKTICNPCGKIKTLWLPVKPWVEDDGFTLYVDDTPYSPSMLEWIPEWGRLTLSVEKDAEKAWLEGDMHLYAGLVSEVQAAVEDVRPAGIRVRVLPARRRTVNVKAHVLFEQGADIPGTISNIENAIQTHIEGLDIGEPLYRTSLMAVARVDGVQTVRSVLINDVEQDIRPAQDEVVRPDTVEVV